MAAHLPLFSQHRSGGIGQVEEEVLPDPPNDPSPSLASGAVVVNGTLVPWVSA
jgi:hypothetical protein